jgi:hypothetical protein
MLQFTLFLCYCRRNLVVSSRLSLGSFFLFVMLVTLGCETDSGRNASRKLADGTASRLLPATIAVMLHTVHSEEQSKTL